MFSGACIGTLRIIKEAYEDHIYHAFSDLSGGAKVIHTYASALQIRGHDVCLVTRPQPRRSVRTRLKSLIKGMGWQELYPQKSPTHFDGTAYELRMLDRTRPITADDVPDADVVIATWWETAEWMLKFPPEKGRQVHFVQHYEAFDSMPKSRVDQTLYAVSFKITISRWLQELLINSFQNRLVRLVPNSVDTTQFHAPIRHRQRSPTVGMVYSLTEWKDCRTGFKAIDILRQRIPDLQLITFGNSKESQNLPMPPGTVHTVLPDQKDIRYIYSSCDVWFCSSISEGFGLPLLEAMACRCPVISTAAGGPEDFVEEGVNGFFVQVGEPEQMAERLEHFFSLSANRWKSMSDAAYARAVSYSWDNAVDLFEQALYDAIKN